MLTMTEEVEVDQYCDRIEYVAGFLIDTAKENVVLILKQHPPRLAGRFNGVGGKIEPGESPLAAMRREFWEETGLVVQEWHNFLWFLGRETSIHFFSSFAPLETLSQVQTLTDEQVIVHPLASLQDIPTLPNVGWVVQMALTAEQYPTTNRYLVHEG